MYEQPVFSTSVIAGSLIITVIAIIAMWKIFEKAGQPVIRKRFVPPGSSIGLTLKKAINNLFFLSDKISDRAAAGVQKYH